MYYTCIFFFLPVKQIKKKTSFFFVFDYPYSLLECQVYLFDLLDKKSIYFNVFNPVFIRFYNTPKITHHKIVQIY